MYCEIKLHTPNGAFIGTGGNVISGIIKYVINIPRFITDTYACMKGIGILQIEYLQKKDDEGNTEKEIRRETYLDVIIETQHVSGFHGLGVYEIPFTVMIPHDIPASLNYSKTGLTHNVTCKILHNINITFTTLGGLLKRFSKEINIIAGLVPKLPMTSVIHGGEKKLTQLFSSKKSYVKVKANILNSVLRCGDKIQIEYEVVNDTNIVFKGIKVKVVEVYTFKTADGTEIVMEENVPDTDSKTASLESGETREMSVEIYMPLDRASLECANIVSREYFVLITVKLPMPHRNYDLKIPIQVGHALGEQGEGCYDLSSFWRMMNEDCDDVMIQE